MFTVGYYHMIAVGMPSKYCCPMERQSNLKSLSLAVDGSFPGYGLAGLAHLNNLRHFSWRGVVTRRNFNLFRTVIEHNAHEQSRYKISEEMAPIWRL